MRGGGGLKVPPPPLGRIGFKEVGYYCYARASLLLFGCRAATKLVLSRINPRRLLALRRKHYELPRQQPAPEFSAAAAAIAIDRGQLAEFKLRSLATSSFLN